MDGEVRGAIKEYIESKKDKKKVFETDIFANRRLSGVNIKEDEDIEELDENILYDREFYQKYYNELKLSTPANRELFLQQIYTKGEGTYIGAVISIKARDKDEFIVKLENGIEVIYDKIELEKRG